MSMMGDQMGKLLLATNPGQGALIKQLIDEELLPALLTRLPEVKPDMVKVFALTYTPEELKFMHAYLTSPTGRAIVAKQGALTSNLQKIGQAFGQRVGTETWEKLAPKFRERGLKI